MNILIRGFVDKVIEQVGQPPIIINNELCPSVRSSKSLCRICKEICPKHAVKKTPDGWEILEGCDLCGLCVDNCPNYVFQTKTSNVREDIDRRGFFKDVKNSTHSLIVSTLFNKMDNTSRKGKNIKRLLLINKVTEEKSFKNASFQFYTISVDKKTCLACPTCEHVCPQGAIRKEEANDEFKLFIDEKWCTGCMVCERACYVRAITVAPATKLTDDYLQERIAVSLKIRLCEQCGIEFASKQDVLCPRCKKLSKGSQ